MFVNTIERATMTDERSTFSECFITGSAAEVTPVASIDDVVYKPPDGSPFSIPPPIEALEKPFVREARGR